MKERIKKMTIKELYEWAIINGVEDYDISVLSNEDSEYGDCYTHSSWCVNPTICHMFKEVEL